MHAVPSAEHFTELGTGTIGWPRIVEQAKRQGIRYAFVDQDETSGPVVASMTKSFEYQQSIKAWGSGRFFDRVGTFAGSLWIRAHSCARGTAHLTDMS